MIFVSSTKPKPNFSSSTFCMPSRSSDMKKRKRIGEMGDPWGIPEFIWTHSLSYPLKATLVHLPYIKFFTYFMIHSGRPFLCSIHRSLSMDTWLYTPLISKLSIDTIQPFLLLQAVCTHDVRRSSANKVDLLLRPPIWFHGSRLCSSAALASLVVTILSTTLASVFSKATGL